MKKRLFAWSVPVIFLICIFFLFPRKPIINRLKVNTGLPVHPDLVAVLGGGITLEGKLGISTRERLDAVAEYLGKTDENCPILVQEYPAGRKKMTAYLVANGLAETDILSSGFQYSDKRGGTENNIEELFHVLKEKKKIRKIVLVTSPYHQRRVWLMFRKTNQHDPLLKPHIYFLQIPDNGEISRCTRLRFWHLVAHEVAGIFFQQLKE